MVLNGDDYVIDYMIYSLLMYSLLKDIILFYQLEIATTKIIKSIIKLAKK